MRQIRNDYRCDEGHIASEITHEVVFQYIDLKTGRPSAPLSKRELEQILTEPEFEGLSLEFLHENSAGLSMPHDLGVCGNPKLIGAPA